MQRAAAQTEPLQPATRLGDALRADALISQQALEEALEQQQRAGGLLGQWLTSLRALSPWQLYQALAKLQHCRLLDLEREPPDPALLDYTRIGDYLTHGYLPWRRQDGRLVIACTRITPALRERLTGSLPTDQTPELALCTPRDLRRTIERRYGPEIEHASRTRLMRELPDYSASYTATPPQRKALLGLFALALGLLSISPLFTLIAALLAANALYLVTIGFKYRLYYAQANAAITPDVTPDALAALEDRDLPVYTVLVPMYREAAGVARLLSALRELDYPKHRLDIKLVIEEDDTATLRAIKQAQPESYFEIIRVPYAQPRTKPRACNYALQFARGEYVTIYDAEDRPEPSQLKRAVVHFRHAPQDVACLQGRLNYYNWNENLLTRFFALEYAVLFDLLLPGLQHLGMPIPLGGTSNHIRLSTLRELRAWDPFNVTEDADLGVRLALCGYRTQMLDSVTLEEAPIGFIAWFKQRTRWIKGYMQTWLVYMRRPGLLREQLGRRGVRGLHLFIGAPSLVFLLSPFLWLFCSLWLAGVLTLPLGGWLAALCLGVFAVGAFCHIHLAAAAIGRWRWRGMELSALLYPFYWFLHSLASLRALKQLLLRPHYWDKTPHGQTCYTTRDIAQAIRRLRPAVAGAAAPPEAAPTVQPQKA